jgi:hypothetical protein
VSVRHGCSSNTCPDQLQGNARKAGLGISTARTFHCIMKVTVPCVFVTWCIIKHTATLTSDFWTSHIYSQHATYFTAKVSTKHNLFLRQKQTRVLQLWTSRLHRVWPREVLQQVTHTAEASIDHPLKTLKLYASKYTIPRASPERNEWTVTLHKTFYESKRC